MVTALSAAIIMPTSVLQAFAKHLQLVCHTYESPCSCGPTSTVCPNDNSRLSGHKLQGYSLARKESK